MWARIGGLYAEECQQWQYFIWFWHRLGHWVKSEALARAGRTKMEFVRLRCLKGYGIVVSRERRKGTSDLCKVRVLRDRRFNWVRKPRVVLIDAAWLTPVADWGMDPWAPYNTGIPTEVTRARRAAAEETLRLRRLRKYLRRCWRGLE